MTSHSWQESDYPAVTFLSRWLPDKTVKPQQPHGRRCPRLMQAPGRHAGTRPSCRHQVRSSPPRQQYPCKCMQDTRRQPAQLACTHLRSTFPPLQHTAAAPAGYSKPLSSLPGSESPPWDDLTNHSNRLLVGVGHHLAVDRDDLAMDLVCPPRVVMDVLHTLG